MSPAQTCPLDARGGRHGAAPGRWLRSAILLPLALALAACASLQTEGATGLLAGSDKVTVAAAGGEAADGGSTMAPTTAGSAGSALVPVQPGSASATATATATRRDGAPQRAGLDSLNPEGMIDFDQPDARRDLWQRVRQGFSIPDLTRPDLVRSSEQWYASRPDYVQRMTARGSRYLFHIVEEVQRRQLPTELALLPFIESAFNPQALSSAKASGMWQFMPATGRDFSLHQNVFRDDRRDVLASTRAALDYLTRLHAQFGHWHLALAAYNWGEGNVQRAIQRNQRAGLPTDYESLRMPDETRRYVPKLLAVKNIVLQPDAFSLKLPPLENHPYFLTVPIERDIDLSLAAQMAGLSVEDFNALNPQHNKPVILAAGSPRILLPYDNAERFLVELGRHGGMLASWTAWVAPKTLKVSEAARLTGMAEDRLRDVNRIPRGMMIRSGSTLLVPRTARQGDVSEQVAQSALMNLQREPVAKKRPTQTAKAGNPGKKSTATAAAKPGAGAKTAASGKPAPTKVAGAAAVSNTGGRPQAR